MVVSRSNASLGEGGPEGSRRPAPTKKGAPYRTPEGPSGWPRRDPNSKSQVGVFGIRATRGAAFARDAAKTNDTTLFHPKTLPSAPEFMVVAVGGWRLAVGGGWRRTAVGS